MKNRQFKYFLVSAGLHAMGFGLIFLGNMIVSQTVAKDTPIEQRVLNLPIIQQIPQTLVDEAIYNPGGAQEIGQPTEVQQPVEQPKAEPPPARQEVKKETKKPVEKPKTEPKVKPKEKPKKETPKTQPVKERKEPALNFDAMEKAAQKDLNLKKKESDRRAREAAAAAEEEARENAEAMEEVRGFNKGLASSMGNVKSSKSSTGNGKSASNTVIRGASSGNGNGQGTGGTVANYLQAVRSIYDRAWVQPPETESISKSTIVKIVINRDGTIRSADIVSNSGYEPLDKSVRNVLKSVRRVPAFPKNSKDSTRTYTFKFSLEGINL